MLRATDHLRTPKDPVIETQEDLRRTEEEAAKAGDDECHLMGKEAR